MEFRDRVYGVTEKIPAGYVTTYGEIARVLGSSPRAVGQALKANPDLVRVPCHRVVMSGGNLGGYSGGAWRKVMLLRREGVGVRGGRVVDFGKRVWGLS